MAQLSEAVFQSLVQNSFDVIAVIGADTTIRYVSPAVRRVFGYEPEELIGTNGFEYIHPEDHGLAAERLAEVLGQEGTFTSVELRLRKKDGTWGWFEIRGGNFLHEPTVAGLVLNYHEISDRKHIENALSESEERFRLLFDTNPLPIWVYDVKTLRFLAVNDSAIAHYGYTRAEFLEMRFTDLWPEEDLATLPASIQRQPPESEGLEFRHLTKDGRFIDVEIVAHELHFGDRRAALVVGHDVTERKRAEKEKRELEEQLLQAQKMEAVGRLAGGVAHDFNNLLAVIINYADFLLEDLEDGDARRHDVEQVKKAGERAETLVRQLLAFSRKEIVRPQLLDLNNVVSDMQKLLQRTLGEDIQLEFVAEPQLRKTKLDPGQAEQILMNLAVNARDAMRQGGKLFLETYNQLIDANFARARPGMNPGPHVCLSVSDTGEGMSQEVLANIFEPFFTTKPRGVGSGLGLSTVYGIVKQADGHIEATSAPASGTTFTIYFPAMEEPVDQSPDGSPRQSTGAGETVLVAEDEDAVRALVERILRRDGYRVLTAASGEQALEVSTRHEGQIDLLLTDVVMPQMSGKELMERITNRLPGIKTIYMSGYTEDIVAQRGVLRDEEILLRKPFTADDLLSKVSETLLPV